MFAFFIKFLEVDFILADDMTLSLLETVISAVALPVTESMHKVIRKYECCWNMCALSLKFNDLVSDVKKRYSLI